MKVPQIDHGVLDPTTGVEITTPLGAPRGLEEDNPYETEGKTQDEQDRLFLDTLKQFHGSDTPPKKHFCVTPATGVILLSEGAAYLREYGGRGNGCYWLFDIISTEVLPLFKRYPENDLISFEITVKDGQASLLATSNAGSKLWTRHLGFADLIDMELVLWMLRGDGYGHVLIPSEY